MWENCWIRVGYETTAKASIVRSSNMSDTYLCNQLLKNVGRNAARCWNDLWQLVDAASVRSIRIIHGHKWQALYKHHTHQSRDKKCSKPIGPTLHSRSGQHRDCEQTLTHFSWRVRVTFWGMPFGMAAMSWFAVGLYDVEVYFIGYDFSVLIQFLGSKEACLLDHQCQPRYENSNAYEYWWRQVHTEIRQDAVPLLVNFKMHADIRKFDQGSLWRY
jgi:hypothetical protein